MIPLDFVLSIGGTVLIVAMIGVSAAALDASNPFGDDDEE